jgi:hypothetical protein
MFPTRVAVLPPNRADLSDSEFRYHDEAIRNRSLSTAIVGWLIRDICNLILALGSSLAASADQRSLDRSKLLEGDCNSARLKNKRGSR